MSSKGRAMEDIQEILEDFLIEAFELIEQIDQDLVELEAKPDDLDLLNSIFRVAHTVKGSSSFLNFDVLTKLTHHMEDVLNGDEIATVTEEKVEVQAEIPEPAQESPAVEDEDYSNLSDDEVEAEIERLLKQKK